MFGGSLDVESSLARGNSSSLEREGMTSWDTEGTKKEPVPRLIEALAGKKVHVPELAKHGERGTRANGDLGASSGQY
jgi:hypothetical protein